MNHLPLTCSLPPFPLIFCLSLLQCLVLPGCISLGLILSKLNGGLENISYIAAASPLLIPLATIMLVLTGVCCVEFLRCLRGRAAEGDVVFVTVAGCTVTSLPLLTIIFLGINASNVASGGGMGGGNGAYVPNSWTGSLGPLLALLTFTTLGACLLSSECLYRSRLSFFPGLYRRTLYAICPERCCRRGRARFAQNDPERSMGAESRGARPALVAARVDVIGEAGIPSAQV